MGSRFIKTGSGLLVFLPIILLHSCLGWTDKEKYKEVRINDEYKIGYWSEKNRDILYTDLKTNTDEIIISACTDIIYNDRNIYIKSFKNHYEYIDPQSASYIYYNCQIDLSGETVGDYNLSEINRQEFDSLIANCTDCKVIDMDSLNKMIKDTPVKEK